MIAALLQLAKTTAIYGLGQAASRVLTLLALPLLTAYLSPEQFGTIAVLTVMGIVARALFGLGVGASTGIVHFEQEDAAHRDATIWAALAIVGASALVLALGALALGQPLAEALFGESAWGTLVMLQLAIVAAQLAGEPLLLKLQFDRRAARFVAVSLGSSVLAIVCILALVVGAGLGVRGWLLGSLIGALAALVLGLVVARPAAPFSLDRARVRQLLRLGAPLMPSALFVLVILNAAPYALSRLADLSETGIFAVGYQLGMGMTLATTAFSTAWYPFFQSYATKADEGSAVFPRLVTAYLLVFGLLTVAFFVFAKPVVHLLTDPAFHGAYRIVGPIAAAQVLAGLWAMLLPGMYFAQETRWVPVVQGAAACAAVVAHLLLIPLLGAEGAALAVAAGVGGLVLLQLALNAARRYGVAMIEPGRVAVVATMIAFVCILQRMADEALSGWPQAAASAALVLLSLSAAWLTLKRQEKQAIAAQMPFLFIRKA